MYLLSACYMLGLVVSAGFSSVQLLSHVQVFVTPWTAHARPPCPSPTPGVYSNSFHWVADAMQPSLLSPSHLPSIFASLRVFSDESVLRFRWPKYWSFSFSINLSREYSGLISFRMEWLISLQSKRLYRVFFSTRVQKYLEEPEPWLDGPLLAK